MSVMTNARELSECLSDKRWRMNNLYSIVTKDGRHVKFRMTGIQERMFDEAESGNRFVVLKARQQKVSSFWILYFLDQCLFVRNWRHRTIADRKGNLVKLFELAKYAYMHLPEALREKFPLIRDNALEMKFGHNNSHFMITLETHSEPVDSLHFSEVAFIETAQHPRIDESLQSVPRTKRTMIVFESISNGVGGMGAYFHGAYIDAKNGNGDYKALFFPWWAESDYRKELSIDEENDLRRSITNSEDRLIQNGLTLEQIAWRRDKLYEFRGLNEEERYRNFVMKYPENDVSCFQTTGSNSFDIATVEFYAHSRLLVPRRRVKILASGDMQDSGVGHFFIYDEPREYHEYVCGADVAKGIEKGDYSAVYVLDKKSGQVVARFYGHEQPQAFGIYCTNIAKYYNSALLSIEKNDRGHACIDSARRHGRMVGFNNFYFMGLEKGLASGVMEYGFHTNSITKPLIISNLCEEFISGHFLQLDDVVLDQMRTYVREQTNAGRYVYYAPKGYHDDAIVSLAIALQMLFLFPISRKTLNMEHNATIVEDSYDIAVKRKRLQESYHNIYEGAIF